MNKRALLVTGAGSTFTRELTRRSSASPPIGLLSMAAVLMMHGWSVRVIDLLVRNLSRDEFRSVLTDWAPGFLGINTFTENLFGGLAVAAEAKRVLPGLPVVMGGPHTTFEAGEALASGSVDYVVLREGEATLFELLLALDGYLPVDRVRGIAYLRDGELVTTPERPFLDRLDQLPLTPYELVSGSGYVVETTMISSRGCPGACIFCASGAMSGRRYRARSADSLFSEVYYRHSKSGQRNFVLFDDTFTSDPVRVSRFCRLLRSAGCDLVWRCDSRVDRAEPDMLAELAGAGCVAVHFGIEAGDEGSCKRLARGQLWSRLRGRCLARALLA